MRAPIHDLHVSNLVTYTALAAAVSAITLALDAGRVHLAAAALGIAAIADTFDGRFARLFNRTPRQARCGREIDSLVDAIAFGAAPIVVVVAATGPSTLLAAAALFYALSVVTRLAFYNVEDDAAGFVGVPTPAAALLCATSLLLPSEAWVGGWALAVAGVAMIAPLAIPRPRALGLAVFSCWAVAVIGLHVMQR
jgi:CDP-diacylglycerol--serine O-phosphatidyltransferase